MKANITTLPDEFYSEKVIFLRVDFNCPMSETLPPQILDDSRITRALPTMRYLSSRGAKLVLVSHLGRPLGNDQTNREKFSIFPIFSRLQSIWTDSRILFCEDCIGPMVSDKMSRLQNGDLLLLENTRFYAEEELNDSHFSQNLSKGMDLFVLDGFSVAHRAHASTVGVLSFISLALAGLQVRDEMDILGSLLSDPRRPFCAVVGGGKVSSKMGVLRALVGGEREGGRLVDSLLVGGAMAFTLLAAQHDLDTEDSGLLSDFSLGASRVEASSLTAARDLIRLARERGVEIVLPKDLVIARSSDLTTTQSSPSPSPIESRECLCCAVPEGWSGLDVGPLTLQAFLPYLEGARTILWNGPLGLCEREQFSLGSLWLARTLSRLTGTKEGIGEGMGEGMESVVTVVCGGDTEAFVHSLATSLPPSSCPSLPPPSLHFSHISSGGGATLEYLEGRGGGEGLGRGLPGLEALLDCSAPAILRETSMGGET